MGHHTPIPSSRRASRAYCRDMEQREREEMDLAARIYEENVIREAILEAEHVHDLIVHHSEGGWPDDHTTMYGQCRGCGEWITRTVWATKDDADDAPMSERQKDFLQAIEDRYRREDAS